MTATEKKKAAQYLIMKQLARIGYGDDFDEYTESIGDIDEANKILKSQMDRVAKIMGYEKSWTY